MVPRHHVSAHRSLARPDLGQKGCELPLSTLGLRADRRMEDRERRRRHGTRYWRRHMTETGPTIAAARGANGSAGGSTRPGGDAAAAGPAAPQGVSYSH